jgi:hypothetical protein
VEGRQQRYALRQHRARAGGLEREQTTHAPGGVRGAQVGLRAAEVLQILARQVHPAPREVLGDVLPVLGELQRGADVVGERDALRGRPVEDGEHQLADGVRGEVAVTEQGLPRVVPRDALVDAVGLQQPREGLAWQRALPQDGLQAHEQRVARLAGIRAVELLLQPREGREAVGGRAIIHVAQFVREPRDTVDRQQRLAQALRQRAAGDGEVLPVRARHHRGRGGETGGGVHDRGAHRAPRQRPSAMIGKVRR